MLRLLFFIGISAWTASAWAQSLPSISLPPPASSGDGKTSWRHTYDLDGDGLPDKIKDAFSGGAHCCYVVSVELSSCKRSFKIPFQMDGGYVGGLDLSQPEHFNIHNFDQDPEVELFMEVESYNGSALKLSSLQRKRYGITENRIITDFSGCRMRFRDFSPGGRARSAYTALKSNPHFTLRHWTFRGEPPPISLKHLARYMAEPYSVGLERDYKELAEKILATWGEARSYSFKVSARAANPVDFELTLIQDKKNKGYIKNLQLLHSDKNPRISRLDNTPREFYLALNALAQACFDAPSGDLALLEKRTQAAVYGSSMTGHGMNKRRLSAKVSEREGKEAPLSQSLEAVIDAGASRFLSVILSRVGAPGVGGWTSYCDLEPENTNLP